MIRAALAVLVALAFAPSAVAEPIEPAAVRVLDGDTIKARGETWRLVGFDAPGTGRRAKCDSERELGAKAKARLIALVNGGRLDLAVVLCSCRPGTQGTQRCNHGQRCGTLKAHGRDVGEILMEEHLARPLVCGPRSCPRLKSWCDFKRSPAPGDGYRG